jgi:transcriptional regulator with XRE-family HTH domain
MSDLREIRKAAGLSQLQLSMRAHVSRFRLSLAESGAIELRSDELTAISKAMRPELAKTAAVLSAHEGLLTA